MADTPNRWATPSSSTSAAEVLYGTERFDQLLPAYIEIPAAFFEGNNIWTGAYYNIGMRGWEAVRLTSKPGIDPVLAQHHIRTLMLSIIPEDHTTMGYKEAAISWLLSLWFEEPTIQQLTGK